MIDKIPGNSKSINEITEKIAKYIYCNKNIYAEKKKYYMVSE